MPGRDAAAHLPFPHEYSSGILAQTGDYRWLVTSHQVEAAGNSVEYRLGVAGVGGDAHPQTVNPSVCGPPEDRADDASLNATG